MKKYLANSAWIIAERVLRMISGLLIGAWVARYLGVDQFGVLAFGLGLAGLFATISHWGMDDLLVREVVRRSTDTGKIVGTILKVKCLTTCALSIVSIPFLFLVPTEERWPIWIILTLAIPQSFSSLDFYLQSQSLSKYTAISGTIAAICAIILRLCLIHIEADLWTFALAFVIDQIIFAGFLFLFFKKNTRNTIPLQFENKEFKYLFVMAIPLLWTNLASILQMRLDQILIKTLSNNYETGLYAVAVRLSEAWYFVPMAFASSFLPALLSAHQQGEKVFDSLLLFFYRTLIWTAILAAILTTLFADTLIQLLFGVAFAGSAEILKLHIWTGVFVFTGVACSRWLMIQGLLKYGAFIIYFGLIVSLVLNVLLIPKMGAIGAAWANLGSQIAMILVFPIFVKRLRPNLIYAFRALLTPHLLWKKPQNQL
jgi:O-antigen/teichoic acid export membrane protein